MLCSIALNNTATKIKQYPQMIIEIAGTADNVVDDNLNLGLSQKCADAVRAYFLVNYFNLHL